ncbi:MAG: roadblock/LC7 domain-containing protein [Promethearchaeota archaeon]
MVENLELKLKKFLKEFSKRTNIFCILLVSQEGLLITYENNSFNNNEELYESIAAISAGILSLSEEGVKLYSENCLVTEVAILAGNQIDTDGFEIILKMINNDALLAIIFPNDSNLGLIYFETKELIKKLNKILNTFESFNTNLPAYIIQ